VRRSQHSAVSASAGTTDHRCVCISMDGGARWRWLVRNGSLPAWRLVSTAQARHRAEISDTQTDAESLVGSVEARDWPRARSEEQATRARDGVMRTRGPTTTSGDGRSARTIVAMPIATTRLVARGGWRDGFRCAECYTSTWRTGAHAQFRHCGERCISRCVAPSRDITSYMYHICACDTVMSDVTSCVSRSQCRKSGCERIDGQNVYHKSV